MKLYKPQTGAALVLSMVILLILTLLGVTAMNTATTQDILVGNLQDSMINYDCSETEIQQIHDDLINGVLTVDGGAAVDTRPIAGAQSIDTTALGCGNITAANYQYGGEKIVDINGCKAFTFEVSLVINSPTGSPIGKTVALSRNILGSCS